MQPGELIYHFVHTIIVTTVVSAFVLWRYRAGVLAGMGRVGDTALPLPPVRGEPRASGVTVAATSSQQDTGESADAPTMRADEVSRWMASLERRVIVAVALVVAACAWPFGYAWMRGEAVVTPAHVITRAGGFLVAAVPMVAVLFGYSLRRTLWLGVKLLAWCAGAIVLLSMLQRVVTGRMPGLDQVLNAYVFLQIVAYDFSVPMVLLFVTGAPRVRGVAPIVFAGLIVFGVAPLLGQQVTRGLMASRSGSDVILRWGLNAAFVLVALPTGWLAWRRLSTVARAFVQKRLSEGELLARVWWLLFVAEFAISYVNARELTWWPFALAGGMYLVFARVYRWGLGVAVPEPRPPRRTLLLLRVFGDTARTERLYDRVGSRWRWLGPITVIAAPDVVARTVDPGDFLEFATGRLRQRFVASAADLSFRLRQLDLSPDPDGRYRVNEMCCESATWRAAVVSLMDRADVVLMDLREFSKKREGCAFELQQLAQRVDGRRIVLVVDESSDRPMIAAHLPAVGSVRVVELRQGSVSDREMDRVFEAVMVAAYA